MGSLQRIVLCASVLLSAACATDEVECGTWQLHGTVVDKNNKPVKGASVASVSSCTLPSQTLAGKKSFVTTRQDGAFAIEASACRAGGLDDAEQVRFVACLTDSTCQCQGIEIDEGTAGASLGKVKPMGASGSPRVIAHGYDPKEKTLYVMFSTAVDSSSVVTSGALELQDESSNCDKATLDYYLGLALFEGNLLKFDLHDTTCLSQSCYSKCYYDTQTCLYNLECWEDTNKCNYNCDSRCTYSYGSYTFELTAGWFDNNLNQGKAAVLKGTLFPQE